MSDIVKKDNNKPVGLDKLKGISDLAPKISGKLDLPRTFHQKVIFLLDASASMTWEGTSGDSKGEEVSSAVKKVIERLKNSKNKNCFDISIYTYSEPNQHKKIINNKSVLDINESNFDPTYYQEPGGTFLYSALNDALIESENYLSTNKEKSAQVLIIILSDGGVLDYAECSELINNTNSNISLSSVYFEDLENSNLEDFNIFHFGENYIDKHKEILMNLSSSKNLFFVGVNAEEIRKHMIKSISTVSKID